MILNIIEKKAQGQRLTKAEIKFFVQGVYKREIPDYQLAALLMAIRIKGMTSKEIIFLTSEYINTGTIVEWGDYSDDIVDKHSTGGVGDKVSIILIPLLKSVGLRIAKLSGQGLDFTGGTIDKLHSIPNFNTNISWNKFVNQIKNYGIALLSTTENLAPVDKIIYDLRDVTSTAISIPLIAASVMSKKIAGGSDNILLDIKVGNGAFIEDIQKSRILAKEMIAIGKYFNKNIQTCLTDMNQPLGYTIGNALEIKESIEVLQGKGPDDVTELCLELAAMELVLSKKVVKKAEAKKIVSKALFGGKALKEFYTWIKLQGAHSFTSSTDLNQFVKANYYQKIVAQKSGFIKTFNTKNVGLLSVDLGAGRKVKTDKIDYQAGITLIKKIGDKITKGAVVMILQSQTSINKNLLIKANKLFTISKVQPPKRKLIIEVLK